MQQNQVNEKAYLSYNKIKCNKHPSKLVEYFCKFPSCSQRLICSSCILKKQYCKHQMNNVIDISQFLYEQKMMHEMKGLAKQPDVFDYLTNKDERFKIYQNLINDEYNNFEKQIDSSIESIVLTLNQLKKNIRQQLNEFIQSYRSMLVQKINQNYMSSQLSKFQSFDHFIQQSDVSTSQSLIKMISKLIKQDKNQSNVQDIKKIYLSVQSLEQETPEIDYQKYFQIKNHFKTFENKISHTDTNLISLRIKKNQTQLKPHNEKFVIQKIINIPIANIKKFAFSNSFHTGHLRTVYTLIELHDNLLASASDDGTVRIFNSTTFELERTFQAHNSGIRSMILLPGNQIATGSYDKTIKIWSINQSPNQLKINKKISSNPLKTLVGHTSCIISLVYLNDGIHIASGSADYSIKLWNLIKDTVKNYTGHMNDVLCLTCSLDGALLISGSADRTIKVWNFVRKFNSACIKTFTGHTQSVWTIYLMSNLNIIFSGSLDKTIRMWDIKLGQVVKIIHSGHSSHITKIHLYSEGVLISSSNDGTLKFWQIESSKSIITLQGHKSGVTTFTITDNNSIISVDQDKIAFLWD